MASGVLALDKLGPTGGRRTEQIMHAIRSAVDDGNMVAGELYSVYQLSEVLGVSRTPVRDALLVLEQIGLIKFERRQGFRILLPDPVDIAEIFDARLQLEVSAVRRAAVDASLPFLARLDAQMEQMLRAADAGESQSFALLDQDLHALILNEAGNKRIAEYVGSLRETTRLLGASTMQRTRSLRDVHEEHRPIIEAIRERDGDAAGRMMYEHLVATGRLLVAQAVDAQRSTADPERIWADVVIPSHVQL
ncbi:MULTISPECIES: GntR family transcriptional regulator [Nocardiaceae]|uniref:GntR family transcriptional regulator n=1 Tax=Rhodococcoides kroppenstedtii TaxID=293050 RepID=A0ABS7NTM4_9NOCA|nr:MULTISPECIES: GntR family transcriptional regulator [Rhodococcus]AMY18441.1 HTH-type transcriptional repressor RspR [Rhodococcus sp. PBTS 1]MBY6312401.1 GntR family transcriptional regulator [Rhodococcus kroppenstedtii]MBY6320287.1 GntR family transcriptional regulator [Rhodococcus kroppenstedtii]MBY6398692.1 GntR family transcriptional regulator [Rhodococcus kroppenstedtii]